MNYLIFVVAVVVATAVLLGLLWWYSTRPLYPEADAYAKKYCSDEQALARASEEAWQQARESEGRAMGDKLEPKEREEPKPLKAYLDWVNWRGTLEQRVAALEKTWDVYHGETTRLTLATPSQATESHIKGNPLAVERDSTTLPTLRFSQSDPPIIKGGHAERLSEFAEPEDVLT